MIDNTLYWRLQEERELQFISQSHSYTIGYNIGPRARTQSNIRIQPVQMDTHFGYQINQPELNLAPAPQPTIHQDTSVRSRHQHQVPPQDQPSIQDQIHPTPTTPAISVNNSTQTLSIMELLPTLLEEMQELHLSFLRSRQQNQD